MIFIRRIRFLFSFSGDSEVAVGPVTVQLSFFAIESFCAHFIFFLAGLWFYRLFPFDLLTRNTETGTNRRFS